MGIDIGAELPRKDREPHIFWRDDQVMVVVIRLETRMDKAVFSGEDRRFGS